MNQPPVPMQGIPSRRLVVEFTKMSGAGNDFIVIDNRFYHFSSEELAELARRFCPRRSGIGADGLLALDEPVEEGTHFRMGYHNADGSIGTMCGNGARCLARYARNAGMAQTRLRFSSEAGIHEAEVPDDLDAPVRLHLPSPRSVRQLAELSGRAGGSDPHFIWTGTEHLVVFVPSTRAAPVEIEGPALRRHEVLGPAGANIDFVEVAGADRLRVRTWEKGVEGETLACGTGATASALVACLTGRIAAGRIHVDMPGGTLTVEITGSPEAPEQLVLEGSAVTVYRGTIEF